MKLLLAFSVAVVSNTIDISFVLERRMHDLTQM